MVACPKPFQRIANLVAALLLGHGRPVKVVNAFDAGVLRVEGVVESDVLTFASAVRWRGFKSLTEKLLWEVTNTDF